MNVDTFEQKQVPHAVFEDHVQYLRDNMELDLLDFEGEIIDYDLPKSMEFEVVEAENAVAGDTATGATKDVVTETGLKVRTPLFIQVGDRIKVNTDSGEYITRV
jgi:elongation factor P